MNIYPYPWPVGTCHLRELPPGIQASLLRYVDEYGILDTYDIPVHKTATEGPYISFSGWKVRVMIEEIPPFHYHVRFA